MRTAQAHLLGGTRAADDFAPRERDLSAGDAYGIAGDAA
jgi:hypothetical protein